MITNRAAETAKDRRLVRKTRKTAREIPKKEKALLNRTHYRWETCSSDVNKRLKWDGGVLITLLFISNQTKALMRHLDWKNSMLLIFPKASALFLLQAGGGQTKYCHWSARFLHSTRLQYLWRIHCKYHLQSSPYQRNHQRMPGWCLYHWRRSTPRWSGWTFESWSWGSKTSGGSALCFLRSLWNKTHYVITNIKSEH